MASTKDDRRARRLRDFFRDTLAGSRQLRSAPDAELFFEAIQNEQHANVCAEKIVSSRSGLGALRDCIRADLSTPFILSHLLNFIRYLSDPAIKPLAGGQILEQILQVIAQPPTLWDCLVKLCLTGGFPDDGLEPLAWLCLELLLSLSKLEDKYIQDIHAIMDSGIFLQASCHKTRELGYRIRKTLEVRSVATQPRPSLAPSPGGRHDNDYADLRDIAIYPTADEMLSTETPFYRTVKEVFEIDEGARAGVYLDNQYRVLREEMLAELREDLHIATGKKKGKRRVMSLGALSPVGLHCDVEGSAKPCSLMVVCGEGLQNFAYMDSVTRKKFLKDEPNFLKHQAFGALHRYDEIYGFAFVDRDIDLLCNSPPVVLLQFTDESTLQKALVALKTPSQIYFTLVGTPVFAYEPVLQGLKQIRELPLHDALLNPKSHQAVHDPVPGIGKLVEELKRLPRNSEGLVELPLDRAQSATGGKANAQPSAALRHQTSGPVLLDELQLESLINALQNLVTLIQGPPGTGKSFLGAHTAKCIYDFSNLRILVISYTNHALDQFLEDLLNIGIPRDAMVRLGSKNKCTSATSSLLLSEQKRVGRLSHESWLMLQAKKEEARLVAGRLCEAFNRYRHLSPSWAEIEEHLEFSQNDRVFYEAFQVPVSDSGWQIAKGKQHQVVGPDYLYQRWVRGQNPGIFHGRVSPASKGVWEMEGPVRRRHADRWMRSLVQEHLETLQELARQYNDIQERLEAFRREKDVYVLQAKRVIGCTTTAAARYNKLIRQAEPDVVLVEEAGEILESHILTSLAPSVKQLILIGDHKQLRPKINNYALSVEKGDGFDLNRSLFERLIMQGASYTTLRKQHRMAPEISIFPRRLTYPDLVDSSGTMKRPRIRGLRDRVIFINHAKLEAEDGRLADRRDLGTKASKRNAFEAELVLKCVKYLAQQGYKTENMVVLTPYLGQLRELQDQLKQDHDPVLSDLDSFELVRAGLVTNAAANMNKQRLRISTIDNYQGEESDIVLASLTRCNENGDVGFMKAPERLNVLISRARNCIVLIGNVDTFMRSKQGKNTWIPFFELLKAGGHLYDGLPVKCERHPDRIALPAEPSDFENCCPDGGCAEACNAPLKCGRHMCQLRCHRVEDHSQAECRQMVDKVCDRQHKTRVHCYKKKLVCAKCNQEDQENERRVKRDLKLEADRLARQQAYAAELQQVQDDLEHQRRIIKYRAEEEEQKKTLEKQRADLAALKDAEARLKQQKQLERQRKVASDKAFAALEAARDGPAAQGSAECRPDLPGSAKDEWESLKRLEKAESKPLDELMGMIGLEDVKKEFLSIKTTVDTTVRQGVSLASERFSCSLLGNPGTGKTTVARLYGRFLTSAGVIPGSSFKETTGSGLANLGVSGCKKLVEEVLNAGGGVIFIDEAYQLTSGHNHGGGGVLDYLLAEVENLRGKVVFVLVGYNKQMESFFAHNPGLPSRFPIEMKFADYTDDELLRILEKKIFDIYSGQMQCEDGLRGLYCRIVARRVGRGRGSDGFGNARAVEDALAHIRRRQADRLRRERSAGTKPKDMLLTKEDLIGPEPGAVLNASQAWSKLQELIGLDTVKEAIKSLVESAQQNYKRELAEEPQIEYSLNKVFLGNPGTGKTTVAKLYAKILVDLGLLSKGEVIVKNPADFVGGALGQSEQQTKGILAAAVGKVLVIDEAYGLYGGKGSSADPYKTAVIDTIVAEVQSVPGDDRCVLLLGYKAQMEDMFQNVNPGLARRFPIASAFTFEDFTDGELRRILDLKLKQQGFGATDQAKGVAMEMLGRARNRPNFGNAGEIDIILNDAKACHQRRLSKGLAKSPSTLEARDLDENFDRAERAETNVRKLFEGTVGGEQIITKLEGYQETVRLLKGLGMDPREQIPFNFLFRGPPGTGKTTTAKKMGKVFYDMGYLATAEVVECSATDLIGQYVGQTGPKVQQLLDKALGRVLFVDEAYRLAAGAYAKEAMDELVDSTTKDRYNKKLVIILAGYEQDINQLMSSNPGLTSRFPEVIDFRQLSPDECITLLTKLLGGDKHRLAERGRDLDLTALEAATEAFLQLMRGRFSALAAQDNWASARDVKTVAKAVFNKAIRPKKPGEQVGRHLTIDEATVDAELRAMLEERQSRAKSARKAALGDIQSLLEQAPMPPPTQTAPKTSTATKTEVEQAPPADEIREEAPPEAEERKPQDEPSRQVYGSAQRDAGVSDAVWQQLQRDRKAEEEREAEYQRLVDAARNAADAARDRIVKRLLEEQRRREHEMAMRKKLETMGVCPVGYQWIKQAGGYRCAGGSHYMSDAQVKAEFD